MNGKKYFFIGAVTSGIVCSSLTSWLYRQEGAKSRKSVDKLGSPSSLCKPGSANPLHTRTSDRPRGKDKDKPEPLRVLEDLAEVSPDLLSRMNLRLFDENLTPILQNWSVIGTKSEDIELVHQKLTEAMEELKVEELKNYEVVSATDDSVRLVLHPIPKESAKSLVSKIDDAYLSVFSPALGSALSANFLSSRSPAVAGLRSLNRVATVTMTSQDLYQKTGRRYALNVRTIAEGCKIQDALKDLDNYSSARTDYLLENIPSAWSHLFKTE